VLVESQWLRWALFPRTQFPLVTKLAPEIDVRFFFGCRIHFFFSGGLLR
jgi:hypothetical protein